MRYIVSLVLALIIVFLTVSIVSKSGMTEDAAVATRVEGTAIIFTGGALAGRPIRNGDSISKNDRIEVEGNSRLELRLPDGGYLRMSENTRLTVRMLQFEKRTGFTYLQVFLQNSKVWVKINKPGTRDSRVDVITSAGTAAGKATVYGVDTEGDAGTTISVYEGAVRAMSAASNGPRAIGQKSAPAEPPAVSVQALQQASLSAREATPPRGFDLKATINDWIRWNLQRDAREGLASITVAPASPTITKGASLQFAAVAHYADNIEKDITSFATWTSSDVNVAKIETFGATAGTAVGASTVAAAIEDIHGSAMLNVRAEIVSIKVTPVTGSIVNGATQQFTAMGTFSDRTVKDTTSSVVWRSSNTAVAFVDATGRAVAGNVAGKAVISASLGSKHGSGTLKVRRELVSITIMPESAIIMPGHLQRFGAVGSYSDRTTEDLTDTVDWTTSDIRVAPADQVQAGRVLGQNAGTTTITATFKNISGKATITVEKMPSR